MIGHQHAPTRLTVLRVAGETGADVTVTYQPSVNPASAGCVDPDPFAVAVTVDGCGAGTDGARTLRAAMRALRADIGDWERATFGNARNPYFAAFVRITETALTYFLLLNSGGGRWHTVASTSNWRDYRRALKDLRSVVTDAITASR